MTISIELAGAKIVREDCELQTLWLMSLLANLSRRIMNLVLDSKLHRNSESAKPSQGGFPVWFAFELEVTNGMFSLRKNHSATLSYLIRSD